ncbi:MAG: hypothetical protein KDK56_08210 [Simkania sp.]|nr:hypothetical protein [Simkania sp.]MCP5491033.1 hypothetical protein [Chlamydiales bacterium]
MAISSATYRVSAQKLTDDFHLVCHGPFLKSFKVNTKEFDESRLFKEAHLTISAGVELIEELAKSDDHLDRYERRKPISYESLSKNGADCEPSSNAFVSDAQKGRGRGKRAHKRAF